MFIYFYSLQSMVVSGRWFGYNPFNKSFMVPAICYLSGTKATLTRKTAWMFLEIQIFIQILQN